MVKVEILGRFARAQELLGAPSESCRGDTLWTIMAVNPESKGLTHAQKPSMGHRQSEERR